MKPISVILHFMYIKNQWSHKKENSKREMKTEAKSCNLESNFSALKVFPSIKQIK